MSLLKLKILMAKFFPETTGLLLCLPLLCGILDNRVFAAESFLDTECLHKAPAGIALTDHLAKTRREKQMSPFDFVNSCDRCATSS